MGNIKEYYPFAINNFSSFVLCILSDCGQRLTKSKPFVFFCKS